MNSRSILSNVKERNPDLVLRRHGFQIGKEIGVGAFAKVKTASCIKDKEIIVAVKIIDMDKAPHVYRMKFLLRELKIWPQLKHSNIIQVSKTIKINNYIYIVMEYATNGDIVEYLKTKGLKNEEQVKIWISQLLQALRYCHKKGIAHRDVKCENLLLDDKLNLKLSDFGFSKQCLDNKYKRMLSSTFCGTAHYVAPEVIRGSRYNPFRSDVWSVGVCTYAMIHNALPFSTKNMNNFYKEQMENNINFLKNVCSSPRCQDFIKKCLCPNPLRRPTIASLIEHNWFKDSKDSS